MQNLKQYNPDKRNLVPKRGISNLRGNIFRRGETGRGISITFINHKW